MTVRQTQQSRLKCSASNYKDEIHDSSETTCSPQRSKHRQLRQEASQLNSPTCYPYYYLCSVGTSADEAMMMTRLRLLCWLMLLAKTC